MKFHKVTITVTIWVLLVVSGCSDAKINSLQEKSDYEDLPSKFNDKQTSLKIYSEKEVYSSSVDEIVFEIKNTGTTNLTFGEPIYVEKLEDGIWYQIPYIENLAFGAVGYRLESNNVSKQKPFS